MKCRGMKCRRMKCRGMKCRQPHEDPSSKDYANEVTPDEVPAPLFTDPLLTAVKKI